MTMKIRVYADEIHVTNNGVGLYYALDRNPHIPASELVLAAGTIGLDHAELGKLADIVTSKDPLAKAEALGVEAVIGIRK